MSERLPFRVGDCGVLEPADSCTLGKMSGRRLNPGDIVLADIRKPRNPKFNRLAHRIGKLVVENIESFRNSTPHLALKRLQIEGRINCDEIGIMVPGLGAVVQLVPRSFSFDSMGEEEFRDSVMGICGVIAERYWQGLTAGQVLELADAMID